jgi:hypothetical protein
MSFNVKRKRSALPSIAAAALALLAAGCGDPLRVSPGDDFQVSVLTHDGSGVITAVSRIVVPLALEVDGCVRFHAAVEGPAGRHDVTLEPFLDFNIYRALVPVAWLRSGWSASCAADGRVPVPSGGRLHVTCDDTGRTTSVDFLVEYAAADAMFTLGPGGTAPASAPVLFPGADPLAPIVLQPDPWRAQATLGPSDPFPFWIDVAAAERHPLLRPRMAAGEQAQFVTAGCPPPAACPDVAVPSVGPMAGERLHGIGVGAAGGHRWPDVLVPAHTVDLAFAGGALVVLSQAMDAAGKDVGSVVSRVVPTTGAADPTREAADVQVIGFFPGEQIRTRFSRGADGSLAFLSFLLAADGTATTALLHATDGAKVTSQSGVTGPVGVEPRYPLQDVDLSPDATVILADKVWFGSPDGVWSRRTAGRAYPTSLNTEVPNGTAWLPGAVALWQSFPALGQFDVEVFDLANLQGLPFSYDDTRPLLGLSGTPTLQGVIAVGDKLVLTTSTGIRVLSADGRLIGGADPLPCQLTPSGLAVQTGPHQAAITAGGRVYVFDLSTMDQPSWP